MDMNQGLMIASFRAFELKDEDDRSVGTDDLVAPIRNSFDLIFVPAQMLLAVTEALDHRRFRTFTPTKTR